MPPENDLDTPHIGVNAFFRPANELTGINVRTLNRTVFGNGLHWPMMT